MNFSNILISWYLENNRDLPWRRNKDPYSVWLSEIILQQTRVAQGTSYYLKFIDAFPTVLDLANASEDQVLKMWQGLGYYSRARNLHYSAKYVANELNGKFPKTYQDIIKLKGVGDYTASAIASICFDKPTAVVDGNVYRVLSRIFGIKTPINSTIGNKEFKHLAQELLDDKQAGTFNQAIMDFGAIQCKPKKPLCLFCPFAANCIAYQTNSIDGYPVKEKKLKIKKRYFNYLVVKTSDNKTILKQRKEKGIWQGLYEFPKIESNKILDEKEIVSSEKFIDLFSSDVSVSLYNPKEIVHKLSHQHLHTRFWIVETSKLKKATIPWSTIDSFAVPVLIAKFLDKFHK